MNNPQNKKTEGLCAVDFEILRELERRAPIVSRELAQRVGVDPQGMGSRLASLHRRGLAEKHCGRWFRSP